MEKLILSVCLMLSLLAKMSHAECNEYKIIDYGDRVEAICVGEPLTEAEKKELEKQKENKFAEQKLKEQKLKEEKSAADISKQNTLNHQNSSQIIKVEIPDDNSIEVISYDVKYIPYSNSVLNERRRIRKYSAVSSGTALVERDFMGDYSIKINAKNNGRRGTVKFKLKLTDFSGYEIQSLAFSEDFEKDQTKTFTSIQPGNPTTFIKSNDWIIETYKQ